MPRLVAKDFQETKLVRPVTDDELRDEAIRVFGDGETSNGDSRPKTMSFPIKYDNETPTVLTSELKVSNIDLESNAITFDIKNPKKSDAMIEMLRRLEDADFAWWCDKAATMFNDIPEGADERARLFNGWHRRNLDVGNGRLKLFLPSDKNTIVVDKSMGDKKESGVINDIEVGCIVSIMFVVNGLVANATNGILGDWTIVKVVIKKSAPPLPPPPPLSEDDEDDDEEDDGDGDGDDVGGKTKVKFTEAAKSKTPRGKGKTAATETVTPPTKPKPAPPIIDEDLYAAESSDEDEDEDEGETTVPQPPCPFTIP